MKTAKESFDIASLSFPGSPTEQARFLVRQMRPLGNVDSRLATLPADLGSALAGRLAEPSNLKTALRKHIEDAGLSEKTELGGSLDKPLSKAGSTRALYFVIHDTSTAMKKGKPFPADMDKGLMVGQRSQSAHQEVRSSGAHLRQSAGRVADRP